MIYKVETTRDVDLFCQFAKAMELSGLEGRPSVGSYIEYDKEAKTITYREEIPDDDNALCMCVLTGRYLEYDAIFTVLRDYDTIHKVSYSENGIPSYRLHRYRCWVNESVISGILPTGSDEIVKVRDDLEVGIYGGVTFTEIMKKFRGREFSISNYVNGCYILKGDDGDNLPFTFSYEMLDLMPPAITPEISIFSTNDTILVKYYSKTRIYPIQTNDKKKNIMDALSDALQKGA